MIICIEGSDGSGKTTLARCLIEHHRARYMHGRVWKDFRKWHAGMMRRALRLSDAGEVVLLDRHWVSNFVYGPIFQGSAGYSNEIAIEFDDAIRSNGGYILCVPVDIERHLARFEQLKTQRRESFDDIAAVAQRYSDLRLGNLAHPGDNLVDQFIRYGDFNWHRTIFHYDVDRDGARMKQFAKNVVKILKSQEVARA